MAVGYNPRITTSGLVLCLDAGNRRSYPGSGTTWTDLSGNGNNGTLTNGPTFSSTEGGSIVFDSVNDYALVTSSASIPTGASARTLSIWFYTNSTSWADYVNSLFYYGSGNTGQSFGIDMNPYPAIEFFTWGGAGRDLIFNTTFAQVGWKNLTITYGGSTTCLIYENAVLTQTFNMSVSLNTTSSDVYIGAVNPSVLAGAYYDGRISSVSLYNRALSATEITQNFNATRGRYGI